jgi:hypothetical protein
MIKVSKLTQTSWVTGVVAVFALSATYLSVALAACSGTVYFTRCTPASAVPPTLGFACCTQKGCIGNPCCQPVCGCGVQMPCVLTSNFTVATPGNCNIQACGYDCQYCCNGFTYVKLSYSASCVGPGNGQWFPGVNNCECAIKSSPTNDNVAICQCHEG